MRGLLLITLVSSAASAQGEEFAMPTFESPGDAGLPAPSAPPLPDAVPLPGPPKPPPPPSWSRFGGSTSVLFSALREYYVGAELALLATLTGIPVPSPSVPGEVEGFLLQLGALGGYGRVGGPQCRGTVLCATRISGGLALKGGWARGMPSVRDSVARAQTMYFGQLDVLLSNFDIESAPLSPGLRTWELLTRLRVGLHFTSDASRVTFTGVTLFAALLLEVIPVSSYTQGVSLGFCAGIGF